MKLTSRVFSTLTNIGGSFVAVEDGVLSTTSPNGTLADWNGSELAEDAVLEVGSKQSLEETNGGGGVVSVPTVKLDPSDIAPIQVAVHANKISADDDVIQQFPALVCSQDSTDLARKSFSFSSESGYRTTEELVTDKWNDVEDDNIVFSSGTRRKIRQTKQPKGK